MGNTWGDIPPQRRSYEEELIENRQCPEIVMIDTEDGRVDGRCLAPIEGDDFACPGHMAEIQEWREMSEAERLHWERQHEDDRW